MAKSSKTFESLLSLPAIEWQVGGPKIIRLMEDLALSDDPGDRSAAAVRLNDFSHIELEAAQVIASVLEEDPSAQVQAGLMLGGNALSGL